MGNIRKITQCHTTSNLHNSLHPLHCTLNTAHCTEHCTLHTALNTAHCTLTLQTAHYILQRLNTAKCTLRPAHYTQYIAHCTACLITFHYAPHTAQGHELSCILLFYLNCIFACNAMRQALCAEIIVKLLTPDKVNILLLSYAIKSLNL